MSKATIPVEIDEAIWAVAESNDPRAVEAFGQRYPAYRQALVERIQLVRRLRTARPDREVPAMRFRPVQRRQTKRWPAMALGGLLFAGLAWGTVAVTTRRQAGDGPAPDPNTVASMRQGSEPEGRSSGLSIAPGDKAMPKTSDPEPPTVDAKDGPHADPFARLVDVDRSHAKLTSVIREIGRQAKLRLEIAPGLEDIDIDARYAGVSAKDALRDLGDNFGFTVVVQEGEHALVIPALDHGRSLVGGDVPPNGGSGPAVKLVPGGPNGG